MGEYFANEIVQSCGKGCETEVTKMSAFKCFTKIDLDFLHEAGLMRATA